MHPSGALYTVSGNFEGNVTNKFNGSKVNGDNFQGVRGKLEWDATDSLTLLPAPPTPGSTAQRLDDESFHQLVALRSTARGELARQDAQLKFPAAAQTFACALGVPVSTTHVISTSIMGVGATKRLSAVKWGVVERILWAWVLTLPGRPVCLKK